MARKQTHTVPNQCTLTHKLIGGKLTGCAVAGRDKQVLALYPAPWNKGRIPSMRELQSDARWQVKGE